VVSRQFLADVAGRPSWNLKMGPTGLETSVEKYYFTLRKSKKSADLV